MPRLVSSALLALLLTTGLVTAGIVGPAAAHEERPSVFPDGTGSVPKYLGLDNPRHRVVCQPGSRRRIARMDPGPLKRRNRQLLAKCEFRSIQSAINTIKRRRTSVYVLPGVYHERRWANRPKSHYCANLETASEDPLAVTSYIGSLATPDSAELAADEGEGDDGPVALSYPDQLRCKHNLNLIAIFGDLTPRNDSIRCDSRFCGTQIVGTGRRPRDVTIDNRFTKLNALRAERLSGLYLRNFRVQQAEFNSVYVMETDGFVIDRLVARANDEYGILAFATDHGVIKRSHTYFNGDSGIYPGSASDVNGDNTEFEARRYSMRIVNNNSHHNMVGYSGTAGNSVFAARNRFHHNIGGMTTDSLFPGHPGLPQDHARWTRNKIYSNNQNYYEKYVHTGVCDKPMAERGYLQGVVCPVIPVPVGTGVLIAGGNYNSVDRNWIWDNWRFGAMQLWVPAPLRDEYDPAKLYDTSNHNHYFGNRMGIAPNGRTGHNGLDFWWDDQGVGNCWERNDSSRGEPTDNFLVDPAGCADGGSVFVPGTSPVKDAGFLGCTQYNRADPFWRDPPDCDWFDTPEKPGDEPSSSLALRTSTAAPAAGGTLEGALAGLLALLLVGAAARRRRARRG